MRYYERMLTTDIKVSRDFKGLFNPTLLSNLVHFKCPQVKELVDSRICLMQAAIQRHSFFSIVLSGGSLINFLR